MFALFAWANFEIGDALVIDLSGQEELKRVIPDRSAVRKFDEGQTVVKDLESSFLPFPGQHMTEHEDRLPLTLRAEVSQGVLCIRGAGKLAGGAGSEDWRWHNGRSHELIEDHVSHE